MCYRFGKMVPLSLYNFHQQGIANQYQLSCEGEHFLILFAVCHEGIIINSIRRCPNLQLVFDRGLIIIDENYTILVSQSFHEEEQAYGIKQYDGIRIALPNERKYYPAVNNLGWHRANVFK